MLEKRFIEILEQYKNKTNDIILTPNIIKRLQYINQCLDHLQNEIDDLNLDLDKPELDMYNNLQKTFGPLILKFILSSQH